MPLQPFLGSPSIALFPFLNMYMYSLKAKLFSRLKALSCIFASVLGFSEESLFVLYTKLFSGRFSLNASPGWFPFLSVTNITKLEGLHQAAIRAITGCLSFSPIPHLTEASLPLLRVTLTHFALSFYERALCPSPSFPISALVRLRVKPRPSWRAFGSTHSLMLPLLETFSLLAIPLLSGTYHLSP